MTKILISYRRADSEAISGRIHDRLVLHYGNKAIYFDIDSIPAAVDFRDHIKHTLEHADVLLAVIGKEWTGPRQTGTARIFDEDDLVRIEVESAIRQRIPVVPLLVNGAQMPHESDLPATLNTLPYLNAIEVRTGVDFHAHVDRVIRSIDRLIGAEGRLSVDQPEHAHDDGRVLAQGEANAIGSGPRAYPPWRLYAARYFVLPIFALLLSDYVLLFKFDVDPNYLRLIAIVISLALGAALYFQARQRGIATFVVSAAVGLVAVIGMLAINAALDPQAVSFDARSVMPSTTRDWQEAIEYFVSVVVGALAGNLIAATFLRRFRRAGAASARANDPHAT